MSRQPLLALLLLFCLSGCSPPSARTGEGAGAGKSLAVEEFPLEEGFVRLTLADFDSFRGDAQTWREEEGVLICSGHPKSYLHTREPYGNFTWRGEFRFPGTVEQEDSKLPNTGFMVHIIEPHQIWPRSLEVQGRVDEMAKLKANGGVDDLVIQDQPEARLSARRPVGEWNHLEIISRDGTLTSYLNGNLICQSEAGELKEGLLGLQAEQFEVHFRHLRIRRD